MLALLLSLAPVVSGGESPRKGYLALADMVDRASLVCIGRVEEIVVVVSPEPVGGLRELPIARVAVERVLKGAPETTEVFHEAWGTWICDTTGAKVGQRALFLLASEGIVASASQAVKEQVLAALGPGVLLRSLGSGDGIALIVTENGEEVAYCQGAPLTLDSKRVRYARTLAAVVDYVAELVRFSLDKVSVRARSGDATLYTSPSGSFDLRLLPDGEARLAIRLGPAETVRRFTLDPRTWLDLRERLASLLSGERRFVGEEKGFSFTRKLAIRLDEASLALAWPRDWAPPAGWARDTAFAPAFADALRAWALVYAAIDCPGCDEYAVPDGLLLKQSR